MTQRTEFSSLLREWRLRKGWSQDELAQRSGISRAGVSAIETGRLVPSTAASLALAAVLKCRVEDLFQLRRASSVAPSWAWPPQALPSRYWSAEIGGRIRLFPVETGPLGIISHDGVVHQVSPSDPLEALPTGVAPERTLVMACCDPAAGLLAAELLATSAHRLVAYQRSSRTALTLLGQRVVHVAGLHLSRTDDPEGNAGVVRGALGSGYGLLHVAHWEEGLVLAPGLTHSSVASMLRSNPRWVMREPGSGARQCLDELLEGRIVEGLVASDHRGVVEAVRSGWADAGVCLRLPSAELGLPFLPIRQEAYDLCFPLDYEDDPRIRALIQAVRSPTYRTSLADLPGYNTQTTGELQRI